MSDVFSCVIDGAWYFGAVASDGWPTGPCLSEGKALERLRAYESGAEVSEAAPDQLSRAQMTGILQWRHGVGSTIRDMLHGLASEAQLGGGLHSEAWLRASRAAVAVWDIVPDSVRLAGGARIRKAAGEQSLSRGDHAAAVVVVVGPIWR